jgi:hypothetical protein
MRYMICYDGSDCAKGALERALHLVTPHDTVIISSIIEAFAAFDAGGDVCIEGRGGETERETERERE